MLTIMKFTLTWSLLVFVVTVTAERVPKCAVRCNMNLDEPVCAYNGKTYKLFKNNCLLKSEMCDTDIEWEQYPIGYCELNQEPTKQSVECPTICQLNFNPICASNGEENRVFGNDCEMAVANCNAEKWMRTRSSDCGDETMSGFSQIGF